MDLQDSFYVIGIIYMCVTLLITIAAFFLILSIWSKVNKFQNAVDERFAQMRKFSRQLGAVLAIFRNLAKR